MISFFIVYLLITFLSNFSFQQYNCLEIKEVNHHFLELILLYGYIFIFIPNEGLYDYRLINDYPQKIYSNIYIAILRKVKNDDLNCPKNIKEGLTTNCNNPVIVMNPDYINNSTQQNGIGSLLIGLVSTS